MKRKTKRFGAKLLAFLLSAGCLLADLGSSALTVSAAEQSTKELNFAFSETMEVGKTYMDGMLSVGTEMAYTSADVSIKDVAGKDAGSASGYVTNKTNPDISNGTGALFRFTPKYDGTVQVALQLGGGKTFKITVVGGEDIFSYENGEEKLNLMMEPVEVKAGTDYYIYGKGTKSRFYSINYQYKADGASEEEALPAIELVEGVKAFDTAQGGGMYATGGRGGDVYVVTSLADDGSEGTLRYGINTAPAEGRIIVFNVGGTIYLKETLNLTDNITIAGQTAPGEGITIAGYDTNISEDDNLIIRFVHFRPGTSGLADGGDSIDALWGRDNDTFIIDHCSFSWNTDECLSTYRGQNGTVQYCIISESLTVSGHSKGRHGYGGIFGGDNTVFQYNLIADHTSRNPRVGGGFMTFDDPEHAATLQISNNVTYNYGYYACYGGGNAYTNYVNNYLKVGPGTREKLYGALIDYGESGDHVGGVYIDGNVIENADGSKQTDNAVGVSIEGDGTEWAKEAYEKEAFASVQPVSAEDAYTKVLAQAGVTYPKRDAIDARIVQQVENGTGAFINTQDDVGGYCAPEVYRDASFDTDLDGIPDEWETAHGLNPNDKTDSRTLTKDGYAWVEVYFNELVAEVTAADYVAKNPEVTIDLANNTYADEGKDVTITATAKATNGGRIEKVVFFNGAEEVATVEKAPYTYTYSGLKDGTYDISVRAYDNEGNGTQSETSKLHMNSTAGTGSDWKLTDIGNPAVKSAASYVDGVMTVKGAGKLGRSEGTGKGSELADATTDDCAFVYQEFDGDMEIVTKLDSYKVVDAHTFNGLMFRESLEEDAATVGLGLSMVKVENATVWSAFMVDREKKGGNMTTISETIDSAAAAEKAGIPIVQDLKFKEGDTFNGAWLKLSRAGNEFIGAVSEDGVTWVNVGTLTVDMPEKAYVGFAVEANKVANQLENYATAYFSGIEINTEFVNITYDVENVSVDGADRTAVGKDVTVQFENIAGYQLPEAIEIVGGKAVDYTYDAEDGILILKNLTEDVTVKAVGSERVVEMVEFEAVDPANLLTVEEKDDKLILTQSATSGNVAKYSPADNVPPTDAVNQSFLLFPTTKDDYTLSMTLKITDFAAIGNGKSSGVFVGAFATETPAFTTLGFRACEKDSLSAYWFKPDKVGNGSPKYQVVKDMEYKVTFGTNSSGQYYASWESADGSVKDTKAFKVNENYMQHGEKARYGIGILGATVEISDMKLVDHEDNVIYEQGAQKVQETPEAQGTEAQDTPAPQPAATELPSDTEAAKDSGVGPMVFVAVAVVVLLLGGGIFLKYKKR